MNHILKRSFYILVLCAALWSCKGETETITVETGSLDLVAGGPFFEGPNMAQASWAFDLNQILGKAKDEKNKIKEARITKVEIVYSEAGDTLEMENMVLEMRSESLSMTRVGLYEGKIEPGKSFKLSLASVQEKLGTAFADGKITFVGDFNLLEEEYWDDINFTLNASFEIILKK